MRYCAMVLAAGFLGLACGCGGPKDNRPARAQVSVSVTYKGAAVEGANVTFLPPGGGKPAFGMTDAKGVARLSTFGQDDGAIPGEYQVTVQKTKVEGPAGDPNNMAPPANPAAAAAAAKTLDLLPAKYASPLSSGLKASVATGKDNSVTFELKD